MEGVGKLASFVLLTIGTLGLLANEFIFDWGRPATVAFGALNILGLIILVVMTRGIKRKTLVGE